MSLTDLHLPGAPPATVSERLAGWGLMPEQDPDDLPHASKNPNLIARDAQGGRFLIKMTGGPDALGVVHEGRVLAVLAGLAGSPSPLALPQVQAFDEALGMLAVRWLSHGENLHYHHRRTQRYSSEVARAIGRGLGWLHAETRDRLAAFPEAIRYPVSSVERLAYLRPDQYAKLSRAGIAAYAALQDDDSAMRALVAMGRQEVTACLVHGDLKQANWLRVPGRPPRVILLDWELAHAGDPAHDLGQLFAGYLPGWLSPRSAYEAVDQDTLVRFFAALYGSYKHQRGRRLSGGSAFPLEKDFSLRVMRWVGVDLVQHVLAITVLESRFDEREQRLLQYALDMLKNPHRWAWELLEVLP